MKAKYNVEELEDDSEDKQRLEKAQQSAKRKVLKQNEKRVEPANVK